MRELFFSNSLIKWLWGFVFIKMKPILLVNYLRRVRSYPFEGEARFISFMFDLVTLETSFSVRLLPAFCQDPNSIKIFSRAEAEKELQLNIKSSGKLNKKLADLIKWFKNNKNLVPSNTPLVQTRD